MTAAPPLWSTHLIIVVLRRRPVLLLESLLVGPMLLGGDLVHVSFLLGVTPGF
jgi:hypothetical protein